MSEFPSLRGPALVVVAHPDDEVLWCGGLMIRHPDLDWTVLSMCRGSDPDRRPRFLEASRMLGVKGIILDVDDSPELLPLDEERDVIAPILDAVGKTNWKSCISHGKNGEYGHQRHVDVHRAVMKMVDERKLRCNELWTFAYRSDSAKTMDIASECSHVIHLDDHEFSKKKRLIADTYGFSRDSFEFTACLPKEGFDVAYVETDR